MSLDLELGKDPKLARGMPKFITYFDDLAFIKHASYGPEVREGGLILEEIPEQDIPEPKFL